VNKWISVEDRLPEAGKDGLEEGIEDVLIAYQRICPHCENEDGAYISIGYCMNKTWLLAQPLEIDVFDESHNKQINVTHWMLLPEFIE
jgi:hypothetical protein